MMTNTDIISIPPVTAQLETSIIRLVCTPEDYSASMIARAVEDSDAHVTALHTEFEGGKTTVTLRITLRNPEPAVRSLERYGYEVTDTDFYAPGLTLSEERLQALQSYLDV